MDVLEWHFSLYGFNFLITSDHPQKYLVDSIFKQFVGLNLFEYLIKFISIKCLNYFFVFEFNYWYDFRWGPVAIKHYFQVDFNCGVFIMRSFKFTSVILFVRVKKIGIFFHFIVSGDYLSYLSWVILGMCFNWLSFLIFPLELSLWLFLGINSNYCKFH